MQAVFAAVEIAFDRAFPAAVNPWRNLGGLAFLLFWIVAGTGIYVYIGFDTQVDGAYASVERFDDGALPLASLVRSVHRYASDAFLVVVVLHLVREWMRGRYRHFRRFSWITGIVALWLLFASGLGGFWLVWDETAQYSFAATLEWLDALPVFGGELARNVLADGAISDRLFSLLVFLHIGFPLALLAAMWIHLLRLAQPATVAPRALCVGTLAALVALALARPVRSAAPADLAAVPGAIALDWFYLGAHAFADATSPAALWALAVGATLLLLALPWTTRMMRPAAARVHLPNCNGCARCADDCPYLAITMAPRSDGRNLPAQAVVDADLCAACGLCAGACSTAGIDLPQAPLARVRADLDAALARLRGSVAGGARVVVFGCPARRGGADLAQLPDERTAAVSVQCAGQLPPSLLDHALRAGADGVLVTGCRGGDCDFRLGNRWLQARVTRRRAPKLRRGAWPGRVRTAWTGRGGEPALRIALAEFRTDLDLALRSPR
ncbi:MAG: hydrogenase iron-sulfur subunit [Burkholderiales bacterium]|nr:hydrogenase iron-sulfur subunit [Burkholderiales bacterium]